MIISIHQPNYLPYIGFFHKMMNSDVFALYDDAEFVKEMYYHRNKIKTSNGELWLTVPVNYKFSDHPRILDISIDNKLNWAKKHWNSIITNYSKAQYFKKYAESFEEIYSRDWIKLVDLNFSLIKRVNEILEISTPLILTSEYQVTGERTEKLVQITSLLKGSTYLAGKTSLKYLVEEKFTSKGMKIQYQKFTHPIYQQLHGEFLPNMCILDLIFNEGVNSAGILRGLNE